MGEHEMADMAEVGGDAELDALLRDAYAEHPFDGALVERSLGRIRAAEAGVRKAAARAPLRLPGLVGSLALAAAALLAAVWAVGTDGPTGTGELGADGGAGGRAAIVARAEAILRNGSADARLSVRRGTGLGSTTTLASASAATLQVGDRVLVEAGSGELTLADGTVVRVRADSEVAVLAGGVGLVDGPGEVFCEVAKRAAGATAFRVETPFGFAEALGTAFSVRIEGARALTTVVEGTVRVRGESASVVIAAGDRAVLSARGVLLAAKPDLAKELAWTHRVPGGPATAPAPGLPQAEPSVAPGAPARPVGAPTEPASGFDLPIGTQDHE